jgi:DNA-binding NtrC family response regulator
MLRAGALDVLQKPLTEATIAPIVRGLRPAADNVAEWRQRAGIELWGEDAATMDVLRFVRKVADSPATVLIIGESGTGKEVVAQALHRASSRRDKPLIALNCAAIPESLLEAELFGHAKGAFTGADRARDGKLASTRSATCRCTRRPSSCACCRSAR